MALQKFKAVRVKGILTFTRVVPIPKATVLVTNLNGLDGLRGLGVSIQRNIAILNVDNMVKFGLQVLYLVFGNVDSANGLLRTAGKLVELLTETIGFVADVLGKQGGLANVVNDAFNAAVKTADGGGHFCAAFWCALKAI